MFTKLLLRTFVLIFLCAYAMESFSVGFRLPNQDPEGIARGNAFVATADNPSAIYYNPAGITQLEGQQLSIGTYLISAGVDYSSGNTQGKTDSSIQAVPQLYYVNSPENSKISYGIGLYAPYGLGIEYKDSPFPTLAIEGDLRYLTINPVIAYEWTENLSIALGATINYSDVDLTQSLGLVPDDRFNIRGDDTSYGFNLGVKWDLNSKFSLGASYRSETTLDYSGSSLVTAPGTPIFQERLSTEAELVFPQYLDLGVAYKFSDDLTVEFNIDWTDWDELDSTVFEGTALGDLPLNFNYESSYMYEFGLTKQLKSGLLLSTGYIYSESSAPDQNFTPLNPDSNLHLVSIGLSSRGDSSRGSGSIGWSAAYHFAYNGGRTVSGNTSGSAIGETADGEYETLNHALNFAVRFRF